MPEDGSEKPKQYRPAVVKALGVTPSERFLASLAEQSFLNLWSYPTPYRDKKQGDTGDGKELCDLLVVCGKYVIIFSEKTVSWPNGDLDLAWTRWAKRAIRDAARQARGAERWIIEHPDRIFLDRECTKRFPIDFPPLDERVIHRVVVASGAAEACKAYHPASSGSLIIRSNIVGADHWTAGDEALTPFAVGDVDPFGSFVHVLNEACLEIMMSELDTITDFAEYLDKKAKFVRSGHLRQANGEENLLAYYAIRINNEGDHDFVVKSNHRTKKRKTLYIGGSHYARITQDPRYIAKKEADEISYLWDSLIAAFTTHMLDGTSVTLRNYDFHLPKNELGVRYMALERRFVRRSHGEAVAGALEKGQHSDIFFRMMISPEGAKNNETAFFVLTFKCSVSPTAGGAYEQYRLARTNLARIYASGILERFPHLKRVIGIACEPPSHEHATSEDMVYAEQAQWTDEERCAIRKDCERLSVFQESLEARPWHGEEFPEVVKIEISPGQDRGPEPNLSRRARRAEAARRRKKRREI